MPHLIFIILIMVGIVIGIFKFFLYFVNSLLLIDETFVTKIKNTNSEILNKLVDEDNKDNKDNIEDEKKIKKINKALRLDFLISLILGLSWFIYPFMLIQMNEVDIAKKSPSDKYLGKWLALMVLASNMISIRYIKSGDLISKQYMLFVKLLCAILVLITTLIIVINTKKIFISNIISLIFTSFWLANSAVGLLISHK